MPGIHLILQGPRSFLGSCCLSLPHSLCSSPKGGATGNESPVVGSNHLTSLKRKANKLILSMMDQRMSLLDKSEITQVRHKSGWKSVIKPLLESWDKYTGLATFPLRKIVLIWKTLHVTFGHIQLQHFPRQSCYCIVWLLDLSAVSTTIFLFQNILE